MLPATSPFFGHEDLICPIHLGLLVDPVFTPSAFTYCRSCITSYVEKVGNDPFDESKKPINVSKDLFANVVVQRKIDELSPEKKTELANFSLLADSSSPIPVPATVSSETDLPKEEKPEEKLESKPSETELSDLPPAPATEAIDPAVAKENRIRQFAGLLQQKADLAIQKLKEAYPKVADTFKAGGAAVVDGFHKSKEAIVSGAAKIKPGVEENMQKMKEGVSTAGIKIKEGATHAGTKIKEGAVFATSKVKEGAGKVKQSINDLHLLDRFMVWLRATKVEVSEAINKLKKGQWPQSREQREMELAMKESLITYLNELNARWELSSAKREEILAQIRTLDPTAAEELAKKDDVAGSFVKIGETIKEKEEKAEKEEKEEKEEPTTST